MDLTHKTFSGQIQVIDEDYSVYVSSDIKSDAFLNIVHDVLSEIQRSPELIMGAICFKIAQIIKESELSESNFSVSRDYNLFCNLLIVIDLKHDFVMLDGGDQDMNPSIKKYDKFRMSISEFINDFFNHACL